MKEFRIILQLGNFFQDHRREARIFITKRFNTIADLEEHITEVFSINNFYLTCQNHLLPCTEDIRVLQEDEAIWVCKKPTQNCTKVCDQKPTLDHVNDVFVENEQNTEKKKKKRKINHDSITHNLKEEEETMKSKHCTADVIASCELVEVAEMEEDSAITANKAQTVKGTDTDNISRDNSVNRSSTQSFKAMNSIGALMESLKSSATWSDDSFVNKSRRKRVRKHKRSKGSSLVVNGYSSAGTSHDITPLETIVPFNNTSTVHLRFDNDSSSETIPLHIEEEQQQPVYNYSALKEEDFLKYPVMQNTLPRKGDLISFKMLKISENYSPEVSKYIVARVLDFCVNTEQVNLKILYGKEELDDPQGKFFIDLEKNEGNTKELQWKQLLTPRLLFP